MGASRGKDRDSRGQPGPTAAAARPSVPPTISENSALGQSGAAAPGPAPMTPTGTEAAPSTDSRRGTVPANMTRHVGSAPLPGVLVSFSDFMSGRAGLADYLARRASGGLSQARPAVVVRDRRLQQLVLRCAPENGAKSASLFSPVGSRRRGLAAGTVKPAPSKLRINCDPGPSCSAMLSTWSIVPQPRCGRPYIP